MNNGISPRRTLLKPILSNQSSAKTKNKRPFDLTGLAREEGQTINDENADVIVNDLSGMIFDAEPLPVGDDSRIGDFDNPESFHEHIEESIEQDDSQYEDDSQAPVTDAEPTHQTMIEPAYVSRKPARNAPVAQMVDHDISELSLPAKKRKPGRLREPSTEIYQDLTPDTSTNSSVDSSVISEKPKERFPPRERDPNARPSPKSKSQQKPPPIREGSAGPRGRSYLVQRSETPATDSGAVVTRSGRASYKPLAAWRGEKVIFGRRPDWETPASVTDIIRTDEVHVSPPPRKKNSRKQRAQSELEEIEEEEEVAEALVDEDAQWETETGIKNAQVMIWNEAAGKYDEDEAETVGMFYAAFHPFLTSTQQASNKINRSRLRCQRHRNARYRRCRLPFRQDTHPSLFRLRYCPTPTPRYETPQELKENANGFLCAHGPGNGRSWDAEYEI